MSALFERELRVVNVGIGSFADAIRQSGANVTHVMWAPPAQGDRAVAAALASLTKHRAVEAANARAFQAYAAANPVLEGLGIARK